MAQNITLLGASYSNVPSVILPKTGGGTASFTDVSDTTAAASDVASGKYFYTSSGVRTQGTASGGGSANIEALSITQNGTYTASGGVDGYSPVTVNVSGGSPIMGTLRPDSELVKRWSGDSLLVHDEGITIPSYSTSAVTLRATSTLETVNVDSQTYCYFVATRHITRPIYNTTATGKGRFEYYITSQIGECLYNVANELKAANGTSYGSSIAYYLVLAQSRGLYFSATSTVGQITTSYGTYATTAHTYSGTTVTIKKPAVSIRGNSNYYSSTYWGYTTDVRNQYVIELWRAPKTPIDGWGVGSQYHHVIAVANNNGTLT